MAKYETVIDVNQKQFGETDTDLTVLFKKVAEHFTKVQPGTVIADMEAFATPNMGQCYHDVLDAPTRYGVKWIERTYTEGRLRGS